MVKLILFPYLLITSLLISGHAGSPVMAVNPTIPHTAIVLNNHPVDKGTVTKPSAVPAYYKLWRLNNQGLSEKAFSCAMKGLHYLNRANLIAKKNIISIIDFSKPSTQKRLFVIDVNSGKILFKTLVAHGQNSGNEYAKRFSNSPESHQSSLGFYITMDTYTGGNGYSLRLKGCEKGINDNAYERAIVVHGADYVSDRFINSRGELGRSYGCPAIPTEQSQKIIDVIKNGSCLFLYHPTKKYCGRSKILTSQV